MREILPPPFNKHLYNISLLLLSVNCREQGRQKCLLSRKLRKHTLVKGN